MICSFALFEVRFGSLMYMQIILGLVKVAEWPPFGK